MCSVRVALLMIFIACTSACGGGWRRVEDLTPRALPARAQVQVWQDQRVTLLHGVTLEPDRLDGGPFTQPPTCDSCRVHLSLTAVDSLRVGNKERAFFRTAGLLAAIGLAWAYTFRGIGGD